MAGLNRAAWTADLFLAETEAMNAKAALERCCALLDELVNHEHLLDDATYERKVKTLRRQIAMVGGDVARAVGFIERNA